MNSGAVTSPTILPPSSRAVSLGIGPPGPCRSDIQIPHNLPGAENDCSLFFEKEKHTPDSCAHLEDSEAEAEAAASAVAVAAISNDEIVGNGLGTCSASVPDTKSFGPDIDGIAAGIFFPSLSLSLLPPHPPFPLSLYCSVNMAYAILKCIFNHWLV